MTGPSVVVPAEFLAALIKLMDLKIREPKA